MIAAFLVGCIFIDADDRDLRAPHWLDVSVGSESTCGLRIDGSLRCWSDAVVTDWTEPTGDFVQVSVGYRHACALEASGRATCWGYIIVIDGVTKTGGATAELDDLTWIQAGVDKTCGLQDDGAYTCWNDVGDWFEDAPAGPVDDLAVWGDACALLAGQVTCWGSSGRTPDQGALVATAIAMSDDNDVCLVDDGGAIHCGSTVTTSSSFAEVGARDIGEVSVLFDGAVCGLDAEGRIDCPNLSEEAYVFDVPDGTWSVLSVRGNLGCAVSPDGFLGCWGDENDPRYPR